MHILSLFEMDAVHQQQLKALAPQAQWRYTTSDRLEEPDLDWADIILGNPPVSLLHGQENLKLICLNSAGSDAYVKQGRLHPKTLLTNASGAYGQAIAEYVLSYILYFYKNLHLYTANQRQHRWQYEGRIESLQGKKVLIVGAGDIGSHVAELLAPLGTINLGIRRTARPLPAYFQSSHTLSELDELLPDADIVVLSLPQSDKTQHLFDMKRLKEMKKDAILINVGRGSAIVTEDLYAVMKEGHLKAAALDVVDPEPLPQNDPLWNLDNLLLTPHCTGGYSLAQTYEKVYKIIYQNLKAYLAAEPLTNLVDPQTGYRQG